MKKPSNTPPFLVGSLLCINLSIINVQSVITKIEPIGVNIHDTTRLKIEKELEKHIELTVEKYANLSFHENARQTITDDLENYIRGFFNKGFLAGKSPQEAYSVNVGFGISFIANKYAELLVVEIGMTYCQPYHYKIIRKIHQMRPKDNRIIIDKNKPLPLESSVTASNFSLNLWSLGIVSSKVFSSVLIKIAILLINFGRFCYGANAGLPVNLLNKKTEGVKRRRFYVDRTPLPDSSIQAAHPLLYHHLNQKILPSEIWIGNS